MIRVMVVGALGKMGRATCGAVAGADDMELAAAVDPALAGRPEGASGARRDHASLAEALEAGGVDVAVDFTTPAAVFDNIVACLDHGVHCVVGTTGLGAEQLEEIGRRAAAGDANCFLAPNFAIGAVLMMQAARAAARYLPDCEIVELHHDRKLDAPSGTSLRTAELVAEAREKEGKPPSPEGHAARGFVHRGIPIHSVRLPGLVAHQEVIFGGSGQTLSIRHDSISRESFMPGVLLAVRRVAGLDGMVVGLEKLL